MNTESTFIILFSIATAVAIAVRRFRVPYTVALVAVGLVLGSLHAFDAPHLTKELLFAIFLPGLLFEAAFNLDVREFWRNRITISALAVPGVIVAIGLTGLMATYVIRALDLESAFLVQHGLVFGALVAATDPIAVIALFKSLHAPSRLSTLVEGESLLNDGTSIVILTLLLAYVGGATTSAVSLVARFVTIVGGGAVIGALIGFAASRVTKQIDDAMIEITITTIAAYGSFVLAEQFHFSGVIGTVCAGMVCGSYGREIGMSASTRLAVDTFWDYVAFALNSIIFLLIGFEVQFGALIASWQQIIVAYLAVIVARGGVIMLVTSLLRRTDEGVSMAWSVVLTWGGIRGALSMVLALGLALDFPYRDLLITMTYGVVILSLVVQGVTMPWILRGLGLVTVKDARVAYDIARGHLSVTEGGIAEVDRMSAAHSVAPGLLDALRDRLAQRRDQWRHRLQALHFEEDAIRQEEAERAVRHLLHEEKSRIGERMYEGLIRPEAYQRLLASVDSRLDRLEAGQFDDPLELIDEPPPPHFEQAPSLTTGQPASVITEQPTSVTTGQPTSLTPDQPPSAPAALPSAADNTSARDGGLDRG